MLALVLMVGIVIDDAIVVLENIFRFIEEKKMRPVRGRPSGHGGDRPGGHGHHVQPGGDLRARLVHVEHLGAISLPVRHHGGGGRAGELAGFLHADADDERAVVARERQRRTSGGIADGGASPRSRGGFLRPH